MKDKEKLIEDSIKKQRIEWGKLGAKKSKEILRKRAEELIKSGEMKTG